MRHRQTKEAATVERHLLPPRQSSTPQQLDTRRRFSPTRQRLACGTRKGRVSRRFCWNSPARTRKCLFRLTLDARDTPPCASQLSKSGLRHCSRLRSRPRRRWLPDLCPRPPRRRRYCAPAARPASLMRRRRQSCVWPVPAIPPVRRRAPSCSARGGRWRRASAREQAWPCPSGSARRSYLRHPQPSGR